MPGGNPNDPTTNGSDRTMAEYIADLVQVKPFTLAVLAGAGSSVLMGTNMAEGITFGALVALADSTGSFLLTAAGETEKIDNWFATATKTTVGDWDVAGFLATGSLTALLVYATTGMRDRELVEAAAIGAVSALAAPRLATAIHDMAYKVNNGQKKQQSY